MLGNCLQELVAWEISTAITPPTGQVARSLGNKLLLCSFITLLVTTFPGLAEAETVIAGFSEDEVRIYADGANLSDPPLRTIGGPSTGLNRPYGVAVDMVYGEIYASNDAGSSVRVFPLSGDGDIAPIRTISGPDTTLDSALGIAVDSFNDEIYVANNVPGTIVVFSRTADGDVAPIRTLGGGSTGLSFVRFVFVDLINDELYVSQFANRVSVFDRRDQGNVAPKRVIEGAATGLVKPRGVFVDVSSQELFVSDRDGNAIHVFERTANGNQAPLRKISGSNTGLSNPRGLILTNQGEILVSFVTAWFDRDDSGNVVPLRTLDAGSVRGITTTLAAYGAASFVLPPVLFTDDFESGDTSAWSSTVQ